MRILSVSHYYPPHVGGLEIIAKKQVKSLAKKGHEVSVIAFAGAGEKSGTTIEDGIVVHRVRTLNLFDTRFGIPFPIGGIGLILELWREVSSAEAVHVHDVFYQSSWIAYLFAYLLGKPLFLTQHVGLVEHPSRLVMGIERIVLSTWGALIFRYSTVIVVYNYNVREFLIRSGVDPHKIQELPNGIDLSLFHPPEKNEKKKLRLSFGLPAGRPLVLFVGRFVPKKGFETLFEARDAAYDLVFAGSGELPKRWNKTDGVYVMGALTQERLASLYRAVDIFALPAKGEILTLSMQEAMASGLPVITTDEPGYAEHALDATLVTFVEPTARSLKRAIQDVLKDTALRERMSAYSLKIARERFDWNKNIESVLALYGGFERKQREVAVTTSWDDGHILDLKLAALMKKYGIAGTFYIAPEDSEIPKAKRLNREDVAELANDFEIGAHTLTHPRLTRIDDARARHEITQSKEVLEEWTQAPITSFCYPFGKYARKHEHMARQSGLALARTTKRFSFARGANRYELPTTVHTYDHWTDLWHIARFVRFNPFIFFRYYRRWDALAMALFDRALTKGGVFHLWGHSWEIEARGEWDRLERVFRHIANRDSVRYIVNRELV
ncbi:MAG: glycosyltransferase [bacterium]|nr:glycosyltransferase [bacterium]